MNLTKKVICGLGMLHGGTAISAEISHDGRRGLIGAEYTAADGAQYTSIRSGFQFGPSGSLMGWSRRQNPELLRGNSDLWLSDSVGVTHRVGLYDDLHTGSSGSQSNDFVGTLTETNHILGISSTYRSESNWTNGNTLWIADTLGQTRIVGFYTAPHLNTDSNRNNSTFTGSLSDSGLVAGYSQRYEDNDIGRTAWIASATGDTQQVGLISSQEFVKVIVREPTPGNTITFFNRYSEITSSVNENGYAPGFSTRYLGGSSEKGQKAWISRYQNASTTTSIVGFYDSQHTRTSDGRQFSVTVGPVNESGYVAGYSDTWFESPPFGKTAWIANASGATEIGLQGPSYEASNGAEISIPRTPASESGHIAGSTRRYGSGNTYLGDATWRANHLGVTERIGLFDQAHTAGDGRQSSSIHTISNNGIVAGTSTYEQDSSSTRSLSSWISDITGTTHQVGLIDDEHISSSNVRISDFSSEFSSTGHIAGYSTLEGASSFGADQSVWIADRNGITKKVGIYHTQRPASEARFTSNHSVGEINDGGYLIGYAKRKTGVNDSGKRAWVSHIDGRTIIASLIDSVHTRDDGYQESIVVGVTNSGFAWGYAKRYNGDSTEDGRTAFLVDLISEEISPITLSFRSSDGFAYSEIKKLSEDGIAIGNYRRYDEAGNLAGFHALIWDRFDGAEDLNHILASLPGNYWWANLSDGLLSRDGKIAIAGQSSSPGSRGISVFDVSNATSLPKFRKKPGPVRIVRADQFFSIPFSVETSDGSLISVTTINPLPTGLSLRDAGDGQWSIEGSVSSQEAGIHQIHIEATTSAGMVSELTTLRVIPPSPLPALLPPSRVVTWGNPSWGGDSSQVSSQIQDEVTGLFSNRVAFAALKENGSIITWGSPSGGGDSSSVTSEISNSVISVVGSRLAFAALKNNGSVVTWGSSFFGADSSAVSSQLASGVVQIFGADQAFAALKNDGSVVTWGSPSRGGDSSSVTSQLSSGVRTIVPGVEAFAALKIDGSVTTWGVASKGGDSSSVSGLLNSGVIQLIHSGRSFLALKDDGSVVIWGGGGFLPADSGALVNGVLDLSTTSGAYAALLPNGAVHAWSSTQASPSDDGDASAVDTELQNGVVKIVGNLFAFAALKDNGSVVTWGSPNDGGNSSSVSGLLTSDVVEIISNEQAFAAIKGDGSVVVWGNGLAGGDQSSLPSGLTSGVSDIVSSGNSFAALKDDGSVVTWGSSSDGGDSSAVEAQLSSSVRTMFSNENAFAALLEVAPTPTPLELFEDTIANAAPSLIGMDAHPSAIPFDDGVENLIKYAFNMNLSGPDVSTLTPTGNSGLPLYSLSSSGSITVLRVEYLRRKNSGLEYQPKKSTNLQPDSFELMTGTTTTSDIDSEWERVIIEENCAPGVISCFSRLEITLP